MLNKLPYYYRKSQVVKDIYDVIHLILSETKNKLTKTDLNLFVATASDLLLYENDIGLPDIEADIETKRARIIARLKGNNVLTKSELKRLINIYDKTGCTITEDFNNNTVTVLFNGRKGIPYNLEQIQYAVEEFKPAHIRVEYEFSHNSWNEVKEKFGTWDNASSRTWNDIQEYDGRTWFYIDSNGNIYLQENNANAYLIFTNGAVYARYL